MEKVTDKMVRKWEWRTFMVLMAIMTIISAQEGETMWLIILGSLAVGAAIGYVVAALMCANDLEEADDDQDRE